MKSTYHEPYDHAYLSLESIRLGLEKKTETTIDYCGRRIEMSRKSFPYSTSAIFLFLLALFLGAFIALCWLSDPIILPSTLSSLTSASRHRAPPPRPSTPANFTTITTSPPPPSIPPLPPFSCPTNNSSLPLTCPNFSPSPLPSVQSPSATCPSYFRFIHEDLRPWKESGISLDMVHSARRTANFRLIILNGKAYVQKYKKSFQTRDVFTLWGILQLLRAYPGRIPDLDLMFDCVDWPVIRKEDYFGGGIGNLPPPLFRYCGNDSTLDIVFPDWSFWGWPEVNIKPWEELKKEIKEGNKEMSWMEREPYAYWKGNPVVAKTRMELLQCNVSESQDWNARIYAQDWLKETEKGYKESDLAKQCMHRYKIYIEGSAWSVSEKYILACDSLALLVTPKYYDFFSRGLMPVQHYWPIKDGDKCNSIKFAVDWGNSHKQKAQEIGKEASEFVQEMLKMENIYDYMFHLLTEYSKLLRYKPTLPPNATELCSELMACPAQGLNNKFMMDSIVKTPRDVGPCELPPPFSPVELLTIERRKDNSAKQVELWEEKARNNT